MASFPFQRLLVADPFPSRVLKAYLGLFGDPAIRHHFVQVVPSKATQPVDTEALRNEIAAAFEGLAENVAIRRGDVLDELLSHAAETHADLLLIGHRLAAGKHRAVARRLAMKAPCSVWMVPEDAPAAISNILAPVDFSARSADALRTAAAIAATQGLGSITAAHVYFDEAVVSYEGHQDVMRSKEESNFETFLSRIDLGEIEVRTRWEESSHVADTILRIASETGADLIVMGTRGRSRSAGILIGSETDRVLSKSAVPVLTIKHAGENLGFLEALLDKRFHRKDEAHFG